MKKLTVLLIALMLLFTACSSPKSDSESKTALPIDEYIAILNGEYEDYEDYDDDYDDYGGGIDVYDVNSSAFSQVGYDYSDEILAVVFHNSGEYWYYGVPSYVYDEFINSDSLGGYYNDYIKGQYHCEKQ